MNTCLDLRRLCKGVERRGAVARKILRRMRSQMKRLLYEDESLFLDRTDDMAQRGAALVDNAGCLVTAEILLTQAHDRYKEMASWRTHRFGRVVPERAWDALARPIRYRRPRRLIAA